MTAFYSEDRSGLNWWCKSHKRRATHVRTRDGYHCCDPALGGIMIPCECESESKPITLAEYSDRVIVPFARARARHEFLAAFQDVWAMPYVVLPSAAQ